MYIHDACEQAYKNGYEAGRRSMVNQCVVCGAEIPEGGHVCKACIAATENMRPYVNYYREKPLNRFQIWMYKICFGICVRDI